MAEPPTSPSQPVRFWKPFLHGVQTTQTYDNKEPTVRGSLDLTATVKSSVQRTCTAYGSPSAGFFREFSFLECLGLELSGGLCPFCV